MQPGNRAGAAKPGNGIMLFEASPTNFFNRFTRASNDLHQAPRTNFTTGGESSSDVNYDEYRQTPSVVLLGDEASIMSGGGKDDDDDIPSHLHRGRGMVADHDFGPAPPPFQSRFILAGAVVGVGVGVGLYFLRLSDDAMKLVALPGELFVRALRCLIVPLVFCVISIVVAETIMKGRTSILRWRTLVPYATTSILACLQGIALAVLFHTYFHVLAPSAGQTIVVASQGPSFNLSLACANGGAVDTLSLACGAPESAANSSILQAAILHSNKPADNNNGLDVLTLVDQLVGIARHVVSSSIFTSFSEGDLLAITIFALPFGASIALGQDDPTQPNVLLNLCRQTRNIFLILLHGLLAVTPFAIVFLIGGAVGKFHSDEFGNVVVQVGAYLLLFLIGMLSHVLVVLPIYLYIRTRTNPFAYLKHLVPAYVFAFGCASSMATLPVTIACIQRAKVNRALIHIAMPFGTPVNLNASGIDYPLALVFLANMSGIGAELTAPKFIVLFFVTLLGCMGTAPVPNAGLVYQLTVWQTLFPNHALPTAFAWIVAIDVIVDRIATVVNVNGNAVVTRILAEEIDEAFDARAAMAEGNHQYS